MTVGFQFTNATCQNCSPSIAAIVCNSATIWPTQWNRSEAIFIAVGTPQGQTGAADLFPMSKPWFQRLLVQSQATRSSLKRAPCRCTPTSGYDASCIGTESLQTCSTLSPIQSFYVKALPSLIFFTLIVSWSVPARNGPLHCFKRIYAPISEGSYYARPDSLPGACSTRPSRPGFS